jgi:hypothetical protein
MKIVAKVKRFLIGMVKDHCISHIARKSVDEMCVTLITLYQSGNASHKFLLKNQFTHTHDEDYPHQRLAHGHQDEWSMMKEENEVL